MGKNLLLVYNKPMIYYCSAPSCWRGSRRFCSYTPEDVARFQALLRAGSQYGVQFHYRAQPKPDGIAQALLIAVEFLAGSPCALALGDNILLRPQTGQGPAGGSADGAWG